MNGNYNVGEVVLGKWTLVKELGAGSYGKVFRAEYTDFGETYESAIKIITVSVGANEIDEAINEGMSEEGVITYYESFVGDVAKEFSIMSKLRGSSNIVGYEDHEVVPFTDGTGWDIIIRMELLTPLSAKLKNDGMSLEDVYKLGTDMCKALELCRANSIIHRDIKSENIMVNSIGDYKLGDFGVARTMDKTMGGMSKKGTYTYMAPEVYKEEPYNHRADIYSLGLVLYRLLNNNRSPFLPPYPEKISPSDRETALARRFRGEALPAPVNATPELSAVILKACAFNPDDRFAEPLDMRLALEAAQRGESIEELLHTASAAWGPGENSSRSASSVRGSASSRSASAAGSASAVSISESSVSSGAGSILQNMKKQYEKASTAMETANTAKGFEKAISLLEPLRGYSDVNERIIYCEQQINTLTGGKGRKKKKKGLPVIIAAAVLLLAGAGAFFAAGFLMDLIFISMTPLCCSNCALSLFYPANGRIVSHIFCQSQCFRLIFFAIICRMNEMLKEKVLRTLTGCVLLLIVVGGLVMMYPNYRRAESLKRQNAELQETIDRKKKEIEGLIENQRRFRTDPDFIEMIARQNRRVFPGELVFTFEKE